MTSLPSERWKEVVRLQRVRDVQVGRRDYRTWVRPSRGMLLLVTRLSTYTSRGAADPSDALGGWLRRRPADGTAARVERQAVSSVDVAVGCTARILSGQHCDD